MLATLRKYWAEYWKSQPKKFCDFCKCWITDNKPSVDFHEKGKRHQENVRNKIDELKKKGIADAKKKDKENDYLRQMEEAALEAFKKDLANDPELAKRHNIRLPADKPPVYEGPQLPPEGYVPEKEEEPEADEGGEWYEAVSDQGYTYYWNTVSGESVWVAPAKYVSLEEQGLDPAPGTDTGTSSDTSAKTPAEPVSVEEIPLPPGVEEIPLPGEEPSNPSPPPEEESESDEEVEGKQDRSSRGVFGTWARVQKESEQQIDLELPKIKDEIIYTPIAVPAEEPRHKFKEKKITSLGNSKGGPVAFKKRKLGNNSKNVRRRNEDD